MKLFLTLILFSVTVFGQGWTEITSTKYNTDSTGPAGFSGTNFTGCPPNNYQSGVVQNGVTQIAFAYLDHCRDLFNAQSGGFLDTKRDMMCVMGGGHASSPDNTIFCYKMGVTPKVVVRLTAPSIVDATCPDPNVSDGTPQARHTYGSMVYIPSIDRGFVATGPSFCSSSSTVTWLVNLDTGVWTNANPSPSLGSFGGASNDGMRCVWNSTRAKVDCLYGSNLMWMEYDPIGNKWTKLTNFNTFCTGITSFSCTSGIALMMEYDPIRQVMIGFGGSSNVIGTFGTLAVTETDFSINSNYATRDLTAQGVVGCGGIATQTGTGGAITGQFPGIAYYPPRDDMILYPGAGNSVYEFNPSTRVCTVHTFTGGPPNTANMSIEGTYGRFRFSPLSGKFYTVLGIDQNIFTFQLDLNCVAGLGQSTLFCKDRDGDGYGKGPLKVSITDLAIDGANNLLVSSPSYTFTSTDLARYLLVTGGTGFTAGTYQITNVSAGKATLMSSPGAVGITGGIANLPGCLGPDADDLDQSVHSTSDALTKWGSLSGWLTHMGYSPLRLWYLSPSGNNGTCVVNDITKPCLTQAGISLTPGDAIILRSGTNQLIVPPAYSAGNAATSGNPYYVIAYPGELPAMTSGKFVNIQGTNFNVVDGVDGIGTGVRIGTDENNSTTVDTNIDGFTVSGNNAHNLIRNVFSYGPLPDGLGTFSGFSGIVDTHITDSVACCNTGQHIIYNGSHYWASGEISIRRNILYNAALNGIHTNGRVYVEDISQNIIYNVGIASVSWQQGVSDSSISNNLLINPNSEGVDFNDYLGSQLAINLTCTAGQSGCDCGPANNQTCTCPTVPAGFWNGPHIKASGGSVEICPYDQKGNLVEGNTIYMTGTGACGNSTCTASSTNLGRSATIVNNQSNSTTVDMGNLTYRNNIMVIYGNGTSAPIEFSDVGGNSPTCTGNCTTWVSSSTFDHNLFFHADGSGHTDALLLGVTKYSCTGATTPAPKWDSSTCNVANPLFNSASINYWSSPNLFNFNIALASLATRSGTLTGYHQFDNIGVARNLPSPSLGALEFASNGTPVIPTNIKGQVSVKGVITIQ